MVFAGGTSWVGPATRAGIGLYSAYRNMRSNRTARASEVVYNGGSTQVSRKRIRTGRSKRWSLSRLKKAVVGVGEEQIWRWQQTSATFLGPGKLFLGWSQSPDNDYETHPVHIMSVTQCPFGPAYVDICRSAVMHKMYYRNSDATYNLRAIPCQIPNGVGLENNGTYQLEKNSGWNTDVGVFHKYTEFRINLYGTLEVPITYRMMLVQFSKDYDPYAVEGSIPRYTALSGMLRDINRTLLYDTVSSNAGPQWPHDCKIIKQQFVTINPPPKTDAAAYESDPSAAAIKEVRWFVRHDRKRDHKWFKPENRVVQDTDFKNGGWDIVVPNQNISDVEWGKRVFFVITATSPGPAVDLDFAESDRNDQFYSSPALQARQGSYDVCVRQCWRTTS